MDFFILPQSSVATVVSSRLHLFAAAHQLLPVPSPFPSDALFPHLPGPRLPAFHISSAFWCRGLSLHKPPLRDSPAFQWYITAKDPAVLQLDGLGCGLQLGGQSSRRGRALVPSIGQGVPIERSDGWMMLCGVLLMGRWQRLEGGLALVVCRLL